MPTFQQLLDPIAGNLGLSALVAAIPLALLFVLLGVFKVKAWLAAVIGLVVSILIAIIGWQMPTMMALAATAEGAFYGAFPIMWILLNAIWVYQLSVITGWFETLGQLIRSISDDQRILAAKEYAKTQGYTYAVAGTVLEWGYKSGIDGETAKKIQTLIKQSKMKLQAAIQGDTVRVTGAKRDDLQAAMALIRKDVPDAPLTFGNFRD